MKHIFITYGDEKFKGTIKRICKEARSLRIFNKIISFKGRENTWIVAVNRV